jgi:hypothetical protein
MARIEGINADFIPLLLFGFIRVNPLKSDLIRVLFHLYLLLVPTLPV